MENRRQDTTALKFLVVTAPTICPHKVLLLTPIPTQTPASVHVSVDTNLNTNMEINTNETSLLPPAFALHC